MNKNDGETKGVYFSCYFLIRKKIFTVISLVLTVYPRHPAHFDHLLHSDTWQSTSPTISGDSITWLSGCIPLNSKLSISKDINDFL